MKTYRKNNPQKKLPVRFDLRKIKPKPRGSPEKLRFLGIDLEKARRLHQPVRRRSENVPAWWAHIWSGLVRDPTAKHYDRIRRSIWLYLYLLIVANRRTGALFRRIGTIASETGLNPRSIRRWLRELRTKGYIHTSSTGRSLTIWISKWRPLNKSPQRQDRDPSE